jgi:protein gp37
VREIRASCEEQGVAFFFKQWGGRNKKAAGRRLDGRTWDAYPIVTARAGARLQD